MKKRTLYYLASLVLFMVYLVCFVVVPAKAGGPWNDQYCDIETTQIKVVNDKGEVIDNLTEEKLVCQDGVKDFLQGYGIADSCEIFTWSMWINGEEVQHRSIACKKMDGTGYEIVKGYHNLM